MMSKTHFAFLLLTFFSCSGAVLASTPKPIEHVVKVSASIEEVWIQWTTPAGIESFFARASHIELEVGGAYEIFFFPDNAPGQRGAEDTRVMALESPHRLAFSWNAPHHVARSKSAENNGRSSPAC